MKRKGRKGMKGRCLALVIISFMIYSPLALAHAPVPFVDTDTDTDTDTTRQDFGYGVGVDTVVYSGNSPYLEEVRIDTRYDIENRETRVFAVARVDLWSLLGGNNVQSS